jgi:hypothetical protein
MSERIFAFLLRLYPAGFRERYYQEAMLLYRDRRKHETGFWRRARLWCDLLWDLAVGLPKTWRTSYSAVAIPSESANVYGSPSFRLLHAEPLRPAAILVGGMLTLTAIGAFAFVLRIAFQHPITPASKSPIESVLQRVNRAFTEPGNRNSPNVSQSRSIPPAAGQSGIYDQARTTGADVSASNQGQAIRERQRQDIQYAGQFGHAEGSHAMRKRPLTNGARGLPASTTELPARAVRTRSSGSTHGVPVPGYQYDRSGTEEEVQPEDTTGAMIQDVDDGSTRPTARETYVYLSPAEVQFLLAGNCATIRAPGELPDEIKNAFATVTRDKPFALADPGANFDSSSMISAGLPVRRLLLAGRCEDRWFIEYERGGMGGRIALMVLRSNPDRSVNFVWGRRLKDGANDIAQLRSVLAEAAYWDAPYSW